MNTYPARIFFRKSVQLFFALSLFLAIGLHTIHFDHGHPREIFGDNPSQAILHGSDKKHLFAPDALASGVPPVLFSEGTFLSGLFIFCIFLFQWIFDPLREAFRRGIVHAKVYS